MKTELKKPRLSDKEDFYGPLTVLKSGKQWFVGKELIAKSNVMIPQKFTVAMSGLYSTKEEANKAKWLVGAP